MISDSSIENEMMTNTNDDDDDDKSNIKNINNKQQTCSNNSMISRKRKGRIPPWLRNNLFVLVLLEALVCSHLLNVVQAWGNSNSDSEFSYSMYGNSYTRDWLYDGSILSFEVLGCVWGMVYDSEEAGCLEDESEDGTYNWYMMANCRRPQVAYSVYASEYGTTTCSSTTFVGSVSLCTQI